MNNETIDAIISGLAGEFIHSNPKDILKDLTPEIARKTIPPYEHSIWDLLHHTVIWNDIFLTNIKGSLANWDPANNWPSQADKENDQNFSDLLQRFDDNLAEVRLLLRVSNIDLSKKHKLSSSNSVELSVIKLYVTIVQHISYHMGQIACVRKMVDVWPPTT